MSVRVALPALFAAAALALVLSHSGEIRERAEAALGRGMPAREAALARGFVLGQDEDVDAVTREDFRRSGLAHLLAVSGQNVALLALLAMPLLAALGMPLRTRLLWVLGLIAAYVPLAGAGPSILRAGIMGGLSVIAMLAGRRASRFYALIVAALVLLAIDPGLGADVGWQLSFAAVLGILLLASPLREALLAWLGRGAGFRALADGAALTVSATLATAPLLAFHFEALSLTTLFANLLALPAVAPAMWLGMLAAGAGQVPGLPLEPLNALNGLLLAYIAQVAAWCGRPSWACPEVHLSAGGLAASYAAIGSATVVARVLLPRVRPLSDRARRRANALVLALGSLTLALLLVGAGAPSAAAPPAGLRVTFLDVGQGDAILLQPGAAPAVLVDGGPPGAGLTAKLRGAGIERLGAAIVSHDQSDHAGGIGELLGTLPVARLLYGIAPRRLPARARMTGAQTGRLARGDSVRSGALRLDVLWPPAELLAAPPDAAADPNRLALVLLARWHGFRALLAADAEAEATPLDPGPIDVLKVAHHGSDDAGLAALLGRARPQLAVISAGEGNPFGHPTPATLATLAAHGACVLRTDRDGPVALEVGNHSTNLRIDIGVNSARPCRVRGDGR